jgi:arginine decarboxylase
MVTTAGPQVDSARGREWRAEREFGEATARLPIPVAWGTGDGATELAAFDAALVDAGVADRNLIVLSSVLPPGSAVSRVARIADTPGFWGDRLYCVLAEARTSEPRAEVWAGIGWMQDETGRGLLVEHHAASEPALNVLIDASLEGLARNRNLDFSHSSRTIAGARCTDKPICALVVAAFEAESWRGAPEW